MGASFGGYKVHMPVIFVEWTWCLKQLFRKKTCAATRFSVAKKANLIAVQVLGPTGCAISDH